MKKHRMSILLIALLVLFSFTACGESKSIEAGGLSMVLGENAELIQGTGGTWEVPGKYKLEVKGVYLDDTGEAVEDLTDPAGILISPARSHFFIVYDVTNLGYDLTDKDRELNEIQLSNIFTTLRINDGKELGTGNEIRIRPYPYAENDYKYDKVKLDYGLDLVENGQSVEDLYFEFVADREINMEKDVLVFTTFFNDDENDQTYDGVFELKFQPLSEYLAE